MSSMQNLEQQNFILGDSSPLKSEEVKYSQELEVSESSPIFEIEVDEASEGKNFERLNLFHDDG